VVKSESQARDIAEFRTHRNKEALRIKSARSTKDSMFSRISQGELKELRESEMWQAGKTVRSLRPENQK